MLLSISGFNLDLHICQDEVQSFSVFSEAESCTGVCAEPTTSHEPNGIHKKPCCTNEHYFFSPEFQEIQGLVLSSLGSAQLDLDNQTAVPLEQCSFVSEQPVTRPLPDISYTGEGTESLFQKWLI